jgi:hemerythrin-like domain-containing protein
VVGARLLRHAVEEEARLMRVIMWEFKGKSEESISIMRYHREILAFVRYRLAKLPELPEKVALREIQIFLNDIRKHHAEEEKVVFPLALKAERLHRKKMKSVGR